MVWRSARISSVLIVSMSSLGETLPSTWTTFSSLKARMTWQIASDSRMFARNLLPRPSPSQAPRTMPAMSTKSTVAGSIALRAEDLGELVEARVGDADDADVGLDRGERVVGRQHVVLGQGVEQGRLADIRQTDDSDRERHVATSRSVRGQVDGAPCGPAPGDAAGRSTSLRRARGRRPAPRSSNSTRQGSAQRRVRAADSGTSTDLRWSGGATQDATPARRTAPRARARCRPRAERRRAPAARRARPRHGARPPGRAAARARARRPRRRCAARPAAAQPPADRARRGGLFAAALMLVLAGASDQLLFGGVADALRRAVPAGVRRCGALGAAVRPGRPRRSRADRLRGRPARRAARRRRARGPADGPGHRAGHPGGLAVRRDAGRRADRWPRGRWSRGARERRR